MWTCPVLFGVKAWRIRESGDFGRGILAVVPGERKRGPGPIPRSLSIGQGSMGPRLRGDDSREIGLAQPCGCGATLPDGDSGRGRGLPAAGTAEERGVVGSITDSRTGR